MINNPSATENDPCAVCFPLCFDRLEYTCKNCSTYKSREMGCVARFESAYSYCRKQGKSDAGSLWQREGRICGHCGFCLSLRLRLGKYASFQSIYSSTVILPSEHSLRLVMAAYLHLLKSGCLIWLTFTRAE